MNTWSPAERTECDEFFADVLVRFVDLSQGDRAAAVYEELAALQGSGRFWVSDLIRSYTTEGIRRDLTHRLNRLSPPVEVRAAGRTHRKTPMGSVRRPGDDGVQLMLLEYVHMTFADLRDKLGGILVQRSSLDVRVEHIKRLLALQSRGEGATPQEVAATLKLDLADYLVAESVPA